MRKFGIFGLCLLLAIAAANVSADEPQTETERWRKIVQQLQTENRALRQEVLNLKEAQVFAIGNDTRKRLVRDSERLEVVRKALKNDPTDAKMRKEAEYLGRRLAQSRIFATPGWFALLEIGALKDGLSIEDAESLLGPATDENDAMAIWYFNPLGRHVAPALWAKKRADGLILWKIIQH